MNSDQLLGVIGLLCVLVLVGSAARARIPTRRKAAWLALVWLIVIAAGWGVVTLIRP